MNGFADHGLEEGNFGTSSGLSVKAFDAFPKTKATYLTRSRNGGVLTILMIATCAWLTISETSRWLAGETTHAFSVEKGVSRELQINIDVVVAMHCEDVHINVQDASGDLIQAAQRLEKDRTHWEQWGKGALVHRLGEGADSDEMEDVHDYLAVARKRRKFSKTPRMRGPYDACRVYGSLDLNKVQGDFHITARGHGYMEMGEHLSHKSFNFSHQINELSFGPFYPSLTNPLDNTIATTDEHFFKYQYYLSIVPTIYTAKTSALRRAQDPLDPTHSYSSKHTIYTNQYAVTEQSRTVSETSVPGIFVKFDIEPILLTVAEERGGYLTLLIRLVNVISGVLVTMGWVYQLSDWLGDVLRKRGRGRGSSMGMLHGRHFSDEKMGLE
ncbi:DUF1692-domain-containing protein [Patellaria atrata CBS 101060]|uniref:Endoplasmic reticulum-Golgi intermediate compartment protein n=1 Tax=Patellaria atrata CBS 101060 TaxID=1346257 RepID=A0A9P4S9A4_9PEZI|nr:DUF1692-domain-containing protein [Patellaria atrata CBS 101060]